MGDFDYTICRLFLSCKLDLNNFAPLLSHQSRERQSGRFGVGCLAPATTTAWYNLVQLGTAWYCLVQLLLGTTTAWYNGCLAPATTTPPLRTD